jgi:hypothetical protein
VKRGLPIDVPEQDMIKEPIIFLLVIGEKLVQSVRVIDKLMQLTLPVEVIGEG